MRRVCEDLTKFANGDLGDLRKLIFRAILSRYPLSFITHRPGVPDDSYRRSWSAPQRGTG